MKRLKIGIMILIFVSSSAFAGLFNDCFTAKDSAMEIAQQLRQESKDLGWEIGKVKSVTVAGVVKSKRAVYPDGDVEVCLQEKDGRLNYKIQSSSKDADKATWHLLKKSKKGWF